MELSKKSFSSPTRFQTFKKKSNLSSTWFKTEEHCTTHERGDSSTA